MNDSFSRTQARSGLADAMRLALAEARISVARFGIGFSISDAWDYIQMEVCYCASPIASLCHAIRIISEKLVMLLLVE